MPDTVGGTGVNITKTESTVCDGNAYHLLDAASVGVAVYTCAGALLYANTTLLCETGYPREAFTAFFSGVPGADAADKTREIALFSAVAAEERPSAFLQLSMRHASGKLLQMHLSLYAVYDSVRQSRVIVRQLRPVQEGEAIPVPASRTRRDKAYAALLLLTQTLLQEYTLAGLMRGVHGVLRELMPAENCAISLTDGPGTTITFPYFSDIKRTAPPPREFGNGLTEFVFIWGKPLLIKRDEVDTLSRRGIVRPASPLPAVWLGVPLRTHGGRSVGVLAVRSYADGDAYTPEDLKLLELVCSYVGGAIETCSQQEALRASEARFRAVFEHSGLGVCMVDSRRTVVKCNRRVGDMFGSTPEDIRDKDVMDVVPDAEERTKGEEQFGQLVRGELQHFSLSCECRKASGALFWCRHTYTAVQDMHGAFSFAVVLLEDITESKLTSDRLKHMAFHDALTGLPNRSLFMDRLGGAVRRANRHADYHFVVLFMDMDRFKVVNDSMGHNAGDALLTQFADRVRACLRDSDTFARFGGDEFAVLMDDLEDSFQANHAIQRIVDSLKRPFMVQGVEVYSGASIGAVFRAREYAQAEDILRDADAAMYRAKENGSNGYEVFDRSLNARMQDILQLENAIRRGLGASEFVPFFQPYVTLQSGRVRGAEALVRWRMPDGEFAKPSTFLKAAEESGLVYELDCRMLEEACRNLRVWRERESNRSLTLNCNISSVSFRRWNMLEVFASIIESSGCRPADICLEITENTLLRGEDGVSDRLWKLKELGVRLALDDFGTGYSSFMYLRQFPVNMIKVDRTFVSSVHEDRASRGIVQAIVSLGRGLGIEVVAEGVETPEQVEVLRELGCEAAQGYFFSRPVDGERLLRMLDHARLPVEVG